MARQKTKPPHSPHPAPQDPAPDHNLSQDAITDRNDANSEEAGVDKNIARPTKWSMGVLNDPMTHEVPGSVLLLTGDYNEPLGLRNAPARTSASSLPSQASAIIAHQQLHTQAPVQSKKTTQDGTIILDPQPDDSHNDPLNWPMWRRDTALLSLGLYCMMGGGMTPILAAGFTNVAATYHLSTARISLTTGLFMMGLGVGSVISSPTAILFGKRPVYLTAAILFICSAIWCALSPNFASLCVARVFQGISLSPIECLPSATIAEIYFLHERAYRIGIYTLLPLGGKNLVPLVSAAIIQTLGWRWVFWIVAMVAGFCWVLLFLFVPETFWDRTPRPKLRSKQHKLGGSTTFLHRVIHHKTEEPQPHDGPADKIESVPEVTSALRSTRPPIVSRPTRSLHVGFAPDEETNEENETQTKTPTDSAPPKQNDGLEQEEQTSEKDRPKPRPLSMARHELQDFIIPRGGAPPTPNLQGFNSPSYIATVGPGTDYLSHPGSDPVSRTGSNYIDRGVNETDTTDLEKDGASTPTPSLRPTRPLGPQRYTTFLRDQPALTFTQQLKPWNGRLHKDKWIRVAIRPFILFAYPSVLWASMVYACSIGWLIVISESVAVVFRSKKTYDFSALSAGLIYLSPFIGGVLGTAVAGKVSDIIVRAMSKRNGGLYEPEFRLVMAAPVALSTVIGLMGFGWSAQDHDAWIVPTLFFGIISFGCALGSTTAITFCVDSYRQYAGEALVTLNFSKNIFHGLVFSLFFTSWLEDDGSKMVFIWLGVIQLILMTFSIPMYIFGKRARMWTVRKNLMESF